MAYHVLTGIAANRYADSVDQDLSFGVSFTGSTANTQTTLAFIHTDNQFLTVPNLGGAPSQSDTFLVWGLSGIAQTLTGCTFSACTVGSLATPLSVSNGGTGRNNFATGAILIGNGTGAINSLTLTNGQLLIGNTGAAPTGGTITAGPGARISYSAPNITIGSSSFNVLTRTTFGATFSTASGNFFTGSFTGSNTIPANTLNLGSVIFIEVLGSCTVSSSTVTLTLTLSINNGLAFNLNTGGTLTLPVGTYFVRISAKIVAGSTSFYGLITALAQTTTTAVRTNTVGTLNVTTAPIYTNTAVIGLTYTGTGGAMTYTPNLTHSWVLLGP